jgi:hypothetical protein
MSSIVTGILSSTVELLWNKAQHSKTAKKLKDGDITDERIREIIVRELNDVKTKIDGLSRRDLLVSCSFLQEGVQLLNVSLDKSEDDQKAMVNESKDTRGKASGMLSGTEFGILSEASELSHDIGKLKLVSQNHFKSAKKRFQEAREEATHAFCNEALNIQDRIFAAKLRVVSEILECLHSPDTAVTSCLLFLENLHDLPAVCEIFSVFLNGGIRSMLNKAERVENVISVMMINYVLCQFVSKFSSKYSAFAWPTIQLSDRKFNPISDWREVSTRKSLGNELIQPPNETKLDRNIDPYNSAVNSRGEIVVAHRNDIEVISRTGERKVVHQFSVSSREDKEGEVIKQRIVGLAVDQENNVYVVLYCETTSQNGNVDSRAVLYILDEHCNCVTYKSELNFLPTHEISLRLAINKNNNIVMTPIISDDHDHAVYVCDHTGQLKHKFEHEISNLRNTSVSDNNEIMLASFSGDAVEIYTEEGNLKLKIEQPAGHVVRGAAFHFVIRKIIVLTKVSGSNSRFLHCYSEEGELETSMFCFNEIHCKDFPQITSHPSGPVAIIRERNITYI